MMKLSFLSLGLLLSLSGTVFGATTILTFDKTGSKTNLSTTYGTRSTNTPNIAISWMPQQVSGIYVWANHAGSGSNSWAQAGGVAQFQGYSYQPCYLTLTPDQGYGITLNSLDFLTDSSRTMNMTVDVYAASGFSLTAGTSSSNPAVINGTKLFSKSTGLWTSSTSNVSSCIKALDLGGVSFDQAITIVLTKHNDTYRNDVAIDNLSFSQFAIPEPSTATLMAGLLAMGGFVRRRHHH